MADHLHLLIAHLSTDATVEHLPADDKAAPGVETFQRITTKCGKTGRWSTQSPRKGVCQACTKAISG